MQFSGVTAMFTLHPVISPAVITERIVILTVSLWGEGSRYAHACVSYRELFYSDDYFCTDAFCSALNFFFLNLRLSFLNDTLWRLPTTSLPVQQSVVLLSLFSLSSPIFSVAFVLFYMNLHVFLQPWTHYFRLSSAVEYVKCSPSDRRLLVGEAHPPVSARAHVFSVPGVYHLETWRAVCFFLKLLENAALCHFLASMLFLRNLRPVYNSLSSVNFFSFFCLRVWVFSLSLKS